jgi:hypothetical protein
MLTRIQRSRKKGWTMPSNSEYAGRPSDYGNPFVIGKEYHPGKLVTQDNCLPLFEAYARDRLKKEPEWLDPLRNLDFIACWCKLSSPCHVDVIIRLLKERYARFYQMAGRAIRSKDAVL